MFSNFFVCGLVKGRVSVTLFGFGQFQDLYSVGSKSRVEYGRPELDSSLCKNLLGRWWATCLQICAQYFTQVTTDGNCTWPHYSPCCRTCPTDAQSPHLGPFPKGWQKRQYWGRGRVPLECTRSLCHGCISGKRWGSLKIISPMLNASDWRCKLPMLQNIFVPIMQLVCLFNILYDILTCSLSLSLSHFVPLWLCVLYI